MPTGIVGEILGSFGRPAFTIDANCRVYSVHRLADFVHCLDVMHSHQVKAETIDMIFLHPVEDGFYHKLTHHRALACRLIAASRTIRQAAVFFLTVKIAGNGTFKVALCRIESMVVDYIHNHTDTSFVKMERGEDGTWTTIVNKDLLDKFYAFNVKIDDKWQGDTPGINAHAVGVNGKRAAIIDWKSTNPEGWESDKRPPMKSPADMIIYEMHHRDFSVDSTSGIKNKGKYLALTEHGTMNSDKLLTGIDHLIELGVPFAENDSRRQPVRP